MAIPKIRPAGGGERAQYLLRHHNDNTIRFVLHYPGPVDPDVLRKAARAVIESVDVLHGTFFSDGTFGYWSINEDVGETNYFHYIETEGDPARTEASLSVLPVYPEDKVQLAVGKIYGKLSLGLTNLGNLNCADYALGGLVPNGGLFGGPLKKKPGMQVSVMSFDGECVLTVVGVYTKEDAALLQSTLDHMAREVGDYASAM